MALQVCKQCGTRYLPAGQCPQCGANEWLPDYEADADAAAVAVIIERQSGKQAAPAAAAPAPADAVVAVPAEAPAGSPDAAAAPPAAADGGGDGDDSPADYAEYPQKLLRELCRDRGLPYSGATKADMAAALTEYDAQQPADTGPSEITYTGD